MEEPRYSVDIRSILEDLGATITLDADVDLPEICVGTESFKPVQPAHLVADVTNSGTGIVVRGTVTVVLAAACSRCLREFPLTVTAPVDGFFVQPGQDEELPEEQEVSYISEAGSIELMDEILTAITLELPFAPLHAEDCPGICPSCGADLVNSACSCEPDASASPFAALRDLMSPEGDE